MQTVTWIHISDLHYNIEDNYDRQIVIDAMLNDIKARTKVSSKLENIDFALITGDIAYHGWKSEYDLAVDCFLDPLKEALSCGPRIFIVPGNHDVDRRNIPHYLSARLDERKKINDFLSSPDRKDERELIFKRLSSYSDSFREQFPDIKLNESGYFYTEKLSLESGVDVAILGLNSAWLCCGDEDNGKLAIGEYQVREALSQVGNADIYLAILHHPFSWLQNNDDTRSVKLLIQEKCHFVLRGHMHEGNVIQESTLEGNMIIIPAGAGFEKRKFPNSYNFVQLDIVKGRGCAYLRSYNDRRHEWQKDTSSTGDENDGQYSFDLPGWDTVRKVLAACYRRAVFTYTNAQISMKAMFESLAECRGILQGLALDVKPEYLQSLVVDDIIVQLDFIERQKKSLLSGKDDVFWNAASVVDESKKKILKALMQISKAAEVSFKLPSKLTGGYFMTKEQADKPPSSVNGSVG